MEGGAQLLNLKGLQPIQSAMTRGSRIQERGWEMKLWT